MAGYTTISMLATVAELAALLSPWKHSMEDVLNVVAVETIMIGKCRFSIGSSSFDSGCLSFEDLGNLTLVQELKSGASKHRRLKTASFGPTTTRPSIVCVANSRKLPLFSERFNSTPSAIHFPY